MKKWLNISLFVLVVVAAGVAFYNKQRQYERLKTEYNEIRSRYKKNAEKDEEYVPQYKKK